MTTKICLLVDIYQISIMYDKFIEEIYFDKDIIKEKLDTDIVLWGPGIDNEHLNWSEPIENKIEKSFGDNFF